MSVATLTIALAAACSDGTARVSVVASDAGRDEGDAGADSAREVAAEADAGSCALPASFGSKQCNECIATTCCAQLGACAADPTCRALRDCKLPCLDVPDARACANTCAAEYPDDAGLWHDIEMCWTFSDPCTFHCL
ncbi:MAG: hypothetical protein KF764_27270 [Labilithrix sp.]|nr:hypothetical protein [Labilithrix sp.]